MAKVTLRQAYEGMPQGAKVGDQIEIDDAHLERLERGGNVARLRAAAGEGMAQATGNQGDIAKAQANAAQREREGTRNDQTANPTAGSQNEGNQQRSQAQQPTRDQGQQAQGQTQRSDNPGARGLDAGQNRNTYKTDAPQQAGNDANSNGDQNQNQRQSRPVGPMTTDTMRINK